MISDAISSWNKLKMLKDDKKTLVGCCNASDQRERRGFVTLQKAGVSFS